MKFFFNLLTLCSLLCVSPTLPRASENATKHEPSKIIICTAPYSVVSPPNPDFKLTAMGIVPRQKSTSSTRATALAKFVARQFAAAKWTRTEIYVFADIPTAAAFARYQVPRRSKPLGTKDFQNLRHLWPKTLVFYAKDKKKGTRVLYPGSSPTMWWHNLL